MRGKPADTTIIHQKSGQGHALVRSIWGARVLVCQMPGGGRAGHLTDGGNLVEGGVLID